MTYHISLPLKDIELRDIERNGFTLSHEAAHNRQIYMNDFSQSWRDTFPIILPEGISKEQSLRSERTRYANGTVTPYAAKDYSFKPHVKADPLTKRISGEPMYEATIEGIPNLQFYGENYRASFEELIDKFTKTFQRLPPGLQEFITLVRIDTSIDRAYFTYPRIKSSRAYKSTCEDVATMTEACICASIFPKSQPDLFLQLNNENTRLRVEMLQKNGFLTDEISGRLLDPVFRSYWNRYDREHYIG